MSNSYKRSIQRGDIYYADLSPVVGSEQGGCRPVLVIQNNIGNHHSPTVIAAAITSCIKNHRLPTHVQITGKNCGLQRDSTILLEQLRTLDKSRLREYIGHINENVMQKIDVALSISIGLNDTS